MNIKSKPIIALYPELADTTNIYRFVEFLNEDVQIFIKECYKHAEYEINDYVNTVCEILMDYLVRKGHVDPNSHRHSLVDCLLMLAGLEVTPYNKLDYNEHKKYIDAMAKMLEENNSNDLMEFYKGHITNLNNKVKRNKVI